MPYFRQTLISTAAIIFIVAMAYSAIAQDRLTYPELSTALNTKLPNQSFKNKTELIKFMIAQIKSRRVDKPLTPDREEDLRQSGATEELLSVIRANSPKPDPESVVNLGELTSRATNLVKPEFTPEALKAGIAGSVKLELQLDAMGNVTSAKPLNTLSHGLTEQAVAAARKSTFSAAQVNGKPTRGVGTILSLIHI